VGLVVVKLPVVRVKVKVSFNAGDRPWSSIQRILLEVGEAAIAHEGPNFLGLYQPTFWEGQPELVRLRALLEREGIERLESRQRVYGERDRRDAPLLRMMVRRSVKGYGGLTCYGNAYDLSEACPRCGTGARRTTPLLLKRSELPRSGDMIQTGGGEFLISPRLADVLCREQVSGLQLDDVLASNNREPLPWLHLSSTFTMPPMSEATEGGARENACPVCDRDGYFDSLERPLAIAYSANDVDLAALPELVQTWECFGNSSLSPPGRARFAQPLLLVRPTLYERLRRKKARRLDFEPLRLVP
jgi:hypothetical protein